MIRDRLGDFALNGKDIGQVPIVGLGPDMRVVAGIDQLRDHPDTITRALHATFHDVRDPELLTDLAQVALRARLVLHH